MPKPTTLYWYPWYAGDWRGSAFVRGLTAEQRGIYRDLLDAQWELGSLPPDEEQLARLASATPKEWARTWPVLAVKFIAGEDGRLVNRKLARIRVEQLAKAKVYNDRAATAGRASWRRVETDATSKASSKASSVASSSASSTAPRNACLARDLEISEEISTSPAARPGALRGKGPGKPASRAGAQSTGATAPGFTRPTRAPERPGFALVVELVKAERDRLVANQFPFDRGDLVEQCKLVAARSGLVYDGATLQRALDALEHLEKSR